MPALGYQVGSNTTIWVGYARFEALDSNRIDEDRFWQQITHSEKWNEFTFNFRTRLEQRVFSNDEAELRLRQLIGWTTPIDSKNRFYIGTTHEAFFGNSMDFKDPVELDQIRNAFLIGFKVNDNIRIEVGYLNLLNIENPEAAKMIHSILLTKRINL